MTRKQKQPPVRGELCEAMKIEAVAPAIASFGRRLKVPDERAFRVQSPTP